MNKQLNALCAFWDDYTETEGLAACSADDLLCDDRLTEEQREVTSAFIKLWELIE